MSCDKLKLYRSEAFCEQTPVNETFTHKSVPDLILDISNKKDTVSRCRTIGVLRSENGHFYLSDIEDNSPHALKLLTSMKYFNGNMPSCVLPNTVQVFGTLQWHEKPILFVKILQILNPPLALRLKRAVTSITNRHLAQIDASERV